MKKLEGLIKNNTWKVVYLEDISPNVNILDKNIVRSMKVKSTSEKLWLVIFIAQYCKHIMKQAFINSTLPVAQQRTKLIIGNFALFGFQRYYKDLIRA